MMTRKERKYIVERVWKIACREVRIFSHRPLLLFTMMIAPVICIALFTSMMDSGLPTKLPAGLVDEDNTSVTRSMIRILGSMEETELVARYPSFTEARKAMQRGEIYAFFYIPRGLTEEALTNRQPKVSFYTNDSYFVAANLLMKDMRLGSELAGLAITKETLSAKGFTEDRAMGIVQPIVVEAHPLRNPYLNYAVYLNNTLVPGILILLTMLSTVYTLGMEWKDGTQRQVYAMGGYSSTVTLTGKLLPQLLVFSLMFILVDVYFYKYLDYPCNSGILPMMLLGIASVMMAQAFGIFAFGIFLGQMRMAMSMCSLWGIVSITMSGFSYPVPAMSGFLQWLSWLFPLRHYYLIYVNQALDGYSILYVWPSVVAILCFMLLPFTVIWRYRAAFLKYRYVK